jgi:hypothetical protein
MNVKLFEIVLLGWVPAVVILFRVIGPSRAVLVGLIGGLLFLPAGQVELGPPGFAFQVNKWNITGLGLILGVLLFDRRSLLRARAHWLDLPMAGFYLVPLVGLMTGAPGSTADTLDLMIGRGLGWVVPYAMGRIYFGQAGGPAQVVEALVISGLLYIPLCLYEEIAGPPRYLAGLIYQIPYTEGQVDRLGGWRPEVFLGSGLALASWMALTTVMATWLWLGGAWRPRRWPAWAPALALMATTLSCRGVYGYITLAIGLAVALSTRWLRSRAILIILASVPFTYMALRGSGLWKGKVLVEAAGLTGRASTVDWRLVAEDEVIQRVLARDPIFGFGTYIWHAKGLLWPDGSWLHALWMGGLVGLALQMVALYLLPAALAISRPLGRPDRWQAMSPAWGLAAWCLLEMVASLHNTSYFTPTALIGGALIGIYLSGNAGGFNTRPVDRESRRHRPVVPIPLIVVVIVLLATEVLGRLPKTPFPQPESPALGGAPPKNLP